MKKIILAFFMMVFPFLGYSQIDEGFEGASFPPTTPGNWAVLDNGVGTGISWNTTATASLVYAGTKSGYMDRENIGAGNTSQDWLITPQITVPANGQLRFFTRQTLFGNNGTNYEIRVSTNPIQNNQAAYTTVQTWTETSLNVTYNIYEEKVVPLTAYIGMPVYVAFVRVLTQPAGATIGDRWLIDNVKVVEQCLDPTVLTATGITPTSANLGWTNNGPATQWEVETLLNTGTATGVGVLTSTNPYTATGLTPGTAYKFLVRAVCTGGVNSLWTGPFTFTTSPVGSICSVPIIIPTLPATVTGNTTTYGDEVDTPQGGGCGATPAATNFLQGPEVFYTYTPTVSGNISLTMTPTGNGSSIFVYNGCANVGVNCIGGLANTAGTVRVIPSLAVVAGQTYVIVISSSTAAGLPYNLVIQEVNCAPPATLTATAVGSTTATLGWTNPSGATSWQVVIGPSPLALPTGSGTTVTTNPYNATGLSSGTALQYYVRADCNNGTFSSWTGPFSFTTTQIPAILNYTENFEVLSGWTLANATQTNKWIIGGAVNNGGAQSLYVTNDNGVTNAYTTTTTSTVHAYRDFTIPTGTTQMALSFDWRNLGEAGFDFIRAWVVPATFTPVTGTQITALAGQRVNVSANLNGNAAFTTSNFIVNGAPYAGATMRLVFEWRNDGSGGGQPPAAIDNVNLSVITCPAPITLTTTAITNTSATLGWTNVGAAAQWEVIVLPAGSPAPIATSVGTITSANPFVATGLTSGTNYVFYVRAICGATDLSTWSGPRAFNTLICLPANQCNFTFRMTDSFGDGWNGNTMSVRQNGIVVATIGATFTTGVGPVNVIVPLCDLLPFELFWNTGGAFANEVGVTIIDNFTDTIFTKAPGTGTQNTILYTGFVSCTPPTCPKPNAIVVTNVTQTTATISWTETGSATQWEVLVVPFGSPVPTPASLGIATANPYLATGLTAGTRYTFYVRAICSPTDSSLWSNGFSFSTNPINDACSSAIIVPVNPNLACAQTTNGTISGATQSSENFACGAGADDDVWYQFTAVEAAHTISLTNSTAGLLYAVYSGTNCGALTQVICENGNSGVVTNLTVGQNYYIRIYSAATTPQTSNFTICVGTVPCSEAVPFCSGQILTFPNSTNVVNLGNYACLGSSPNSTFYFLQVNQAGVLNYLMTQSTTAGGPANIDVDYALWGPFTTNAIACQNIPNDTPIQCSYSAAPTENFSITAQLCEIYVLMLTNFSNNPGFITLSQTNTSTGGQTACYPYNTFNYSATTYCQNAANQTPTLVTGAAAGTYTASPAGMVIDSVTGVINIGASLPGVYTVTSTTVPTVGGVCPGIDNIVTTRTVIIKALSMATISYPAATYCNSDDTQKTINLTGTTGGVFSAAPAGLFINATTGTIIPGISLPGLYTVSYNILATGGCPAFVTTTTVEILAAPILAYQPDVTNCNTYTLPALTLGSYYTGSGGTGTLLAAGTVITTSQTLYVYATNAQCSSEEVFVVNIVIVVDPTISITDQPNCAVQTGSINVLTPISATAAAPTNLFISEVTDEESGSLTYIEIYNGTGATVDLTGYKLKIYNNGSATVSCDLSLSGNLLNNDVVVIKVSTDANIGGVTPDLTFTTCGGVNNNDNIRLTTSTNVEVDMWGPTNGTIFTPANQPGYTYRRLVTATVPSLTWNPADWNAIDPQNYSDIGNYTLSIANYEYAVDGGVYQTSVTFSGLAPGIHTLVVHDLVSGCFSNPFSFTINAVPYTNPVTTFTYNTPVCISNTTNPMPIIVAGFNTGGVYSSTAGLAIDSTSGEINLVTSAPGSYIVTYTFALDLANCINAGTSTFSVTINDANNTSFAAIPNLCRGKQAHVLPSTSIEGYTGTWSPLTISNSTIGSTTYTFTPDSQFCANPTTLNVIVQNCEIPKGISPDNNNENDTFDLTGFGVKQLSIYNRYGAKVYTLANYTNEWKGQTDSGNNLPVGTYYYVVDFIEGESKTGWVYINK